MTRLVRLGDVCEVLNGFAFKSSKYVTAGIRVIRITNVQKGYIEDSDPQYYPEADRPEIERYMLCEGDLLMSLTGNVGRVALLRKEMLPAALNQRVACLRIKCPNVIYKPFLYHFLNSDLFEERCIFSSNGIAQKNLSTEWLKEYKIPLFSMEQQHEIADVFDRLDNIISSRKSQLENLDQLVKSRFIELFGSIPKSDYTLMKEVCSIITDGTHQPPKFASTGIPFIFVSNLSTNSITYNAEKFITEDTYNELIKRTPIEIGDVLLTTVGSYGHPAIVKSSRKFLFQRHIAYLKPKREIVNSTYLHGFLLSSIGQEQIEDRVKGIAQKTLNLSEIKNIALPIPPMELQNEFAAFVEQTDKLKLAVQEALAELETLKKSLMQQYFG